jgi:hypothetical protein
VSHKSLIKNVSITQAGKAHSAAHNKKYRFTKGEYRLTVKEDRDESHYPLAIAEVCITSSIKRLEELLTEVRLLQSSSGEDA